MSTLYITEFSLQGMDLNAKQAPVALLPPINQQAITISSSSSQSTALNAETTLVRLHTDTACWIEVGSNPTATNAKMKMPADSTEYFSVRPGATVKIAAITA